MPQAQREELWLIDLGMVQKTRPCLILSIAYLDNERAVVSHVPRTTSVRGTRFEVPDTSHGMEMGAFDAQGIGSIPIVKLERKLGTIDLTTLQKVETAAKRWLNLP